MKNKIVNLLIILLIAIMVFPLNIFASEDMKKYSAEEIIKYYEEQGGDLSQLDFETLNEWYLTIASEAYAKKIKGEETGREESIANVIYKEASIKIVREGTTKELKELDSESIVTIYKNNGLSGVRKEVLNSWKNKLELGALEMEELAADTTQSEEVRNKARLSQNELNNIKNLISKELDIIEETQVSDALNYYYDNNGVFNSKDTNTLNKWIGYIEKYMSSGGRNSDAIDAKTSMQGVIDNRTEQNNPNNYKPTGGTGNYTKLTKLAGKILGVIQVVGSVVSVAVLVILGIKYMFASLEERATFKQTAILYVVGCIMVFSISNIVKIIYDIATNLG